MIDDDKIFVVENCVDDQYLLTDKEIEEKLAALGNKKVLHVLWLSNFIRSKGYPFVLEMAKAEKERVDAGGEKRFHFDFAGKFFEDSEKVEFALRYGRAMSPTMSCPTVWATARRSCGSR